MKLTVLIYQVISNLLNNALKSSKKSIDSDNNYSIDYDTSSTITVIASIKKCIKYNTDDKNDNVSSNRLSDHHDEVTISIKDRGTGIDPDIKDKLFSKFVTKSDAGSGLGLYICKGIVEAHNGRIWAENNADGKGAIFAFSLPVVNK